MDYKQNFALLASLLTDHPEIQLVDLISIRELQTFFSGSKNSRMQPEKVL
jgi:hypothetical protein